MKALLYILTAILSIGTISKLEAQYTYGTKPKPIVLTGHFNELKSGDSLQISASLLIDGAFFSVSKKNVNVGTARFFIAFPAVRAPAILQFKMDTLKNDSTSAILLISSLFLVEPGDTIEIVKGASKYFYRSRDNKIALLQKINDISNDLTSKRWTYGSEMKPDKQDYQYMDSISYVQLSYLDSIKGKISSAAYNISKVNILCRNLRAKLFSVRQVLKDNHLQLSKLISKPDSRYPNISAIKDSLKTYNDPIPAKLSAMISNHSVFVPYSTYIFYVRYQYEKDSCIVPDRPFDWNKYYYFLRNNYKGFLREMLIANTLYVDSKEYKDRGMLIRDALAFMKDKSLRNNLKKLSTGVKGDHAFAFKLPDLNGRNVVLDSLKGKVVVLDFWFTGCTYCVAMHPKFEKVVDYFSGNSNVVFISVNIDEKMADWKKSAAQGIYTSTDKPNVLNVYTEGLGLKHPMPTFHNVKGAPTLIVVSKAGKIDDAPTDPRTDNGKDLIKQIEKLLEEKAK